MLTRRTGLNEHIPPVTCGWSPLLPLPLPINSPFEVERVEASFAALMPSVDDFRGTELPAPIPAPLEFGNNFLCLPTARSQPEYPASALRRKIEGQVVVDLAIDRTGRVSKASVRQTEPAGVFDAAALRAVRRWRYTVSESGANCDRTQVRLRFELPPETL